MQDPRKLEEGFSAGTQDDGHKGKIDITRETEQKRTMTTTATVRPPEDPPLARQKTKRVATLDAFRGLTVVVPEAVPVLMILVDDGGPVYPRMMEHSPWNGCTLADFVMPFFLFIVGVAIALAFKRIPKVSFAIRKIALRTLKLLFWGILLQGGYSHAPDYLTYGVDVKKIRWFGILQRIALVYFVVAFIEVLTTKLRPTSLEPNHFSIFTTYKWQWMGGFVAFIIYMVLTFSLYVPDWSFVVYHNHMPQRYTVKCGTRGHLGPACNAVGYVDRQVWGINHLYDQPVWRRSKACTLSSPGDGPLRSDAPSWCRAPFEPEGLLSSISAIMSGTIGVHYGHVLIHFEGHIERLKQWVSLALVLLTVTLVLHFTDAIPINKQLYSFSYVCATAGAAGIVFAGFYLLVDVWGIRRPFMFLEWIGMNAMLVFVMAAEGIFAGFINGWYFENPENNLVNWIEQHVFIDVWKSERVGTLLYVIFGEITFWAVVSGILHKLGVYWKL